MIAFNNITPKVVLGFVVENELGVTPQQMQLPPLLLVRLDEAELVMVNAALRAGGMIDSQVVNGMWDREAVFVMIEALRNYPKYPACVRARIYLEGLVQS